MFPPLPAWHAAHPLVVHFPLGLLMVAPLLILAAIVRPAHRHPYAVAAFLVILCGTLGALLAVATGEEAAEWAPHTPQVHALIEHHEHLGELTRNLFLGLTALYALVVFGPLALRRNLSSKTAVAAQVLFLALYFGGLTQLAWTGHVGAELVHGQGVRAAWSAPPTAVSPEHEEGDED